MGIGRVSRIHRTYQRQRRRSRSRQQGRNQFLMRYLRLILIVITVIFLVSVSWILYQQVNETKKNLVKNFSEVEETPATLLTSKQSVTIVDHWLRSESPSQMAETTRLAGLTQTQAFDKLRTFLAHMGNVKKIKWLGTDQSFSTPAEKVLVSFESGKYRVASLIQNQQGVWQVDLASFIAMNSKPWNDIIQSTMSDALVRVMISHDSYYNGTFVDEQKWSCYSLAHPDFSEVLYGYVKKDSSSYNSIQEIMGQNPSIPVTLEITRNQDMLKSQCEIKKIITKGWLALETSKEP